ncbi:hypothetical protein P691DRAFT_694151 [Macrolepiota fuliginosa MF-IS2]|uniref:F-box domain-containing protein n=1 Tax=Macrolepiota fuliginosa MF-IS2 TaxID=1400762 RepID=A0A9P5XN69_9AGAR|nr:hypothetical protein P691DRAFT_694151 [Macrolepiota fuliginosa MF-IS2]
MSSLFPTVANILPKFIAGNGMKEYSKRFPSCYFLRLPLLVYLDHIFPCLGVEDVIRLRRVNKAFFLITHEPSIWRRFLERMNHHPVIYLRPTFDYSSTLTDYEVEQIVTRTISLDDNWRDPKPKVISRLLLETYYEVLDMTILPGGKHLVASVKDRGNYRYYIVLYILDHPSGPRAIARVATAAKAFHLQAKYMKINGEYGITISCTCRRYINGGPHNINISDLSHQHVVDIPEPHFSEVMVFYTPLSVIEYLSDPNLVWRSPEHRSRAEEQTEPPLQRCATWETRENIQHISMFDNDGEAWMAIVTQHKYIHFVHLNETEAIYLHTQDHPDFHTQKIKAILPLPKQKEILVVRQMISRGSEEWVVELYPFPTQSMEMNPTHYVVVRQAFPGSLTKVSISDPQFPSSSPTLPPLQPNPLPPISIYFQHRQPHGLMHFCLWPMYETRSDGKQWCVPRYTVDPTPPPGGPTPTWQVLQNEAKDHYSIQTCHLCDPHVAHVLPGGYRAIYYTTLYDDRKASPSMIKLRRYLSPEVQKLAYPPRPADNSLAFMDKKRRYHPSGLYGTIDIALEDAKAFETGINAISWDETTGRICIAVEGELSVRILDMARNVEPDKRFVSWRDATFHEMGKMGCFTSKDCIHRVSIPGW